MRIKQLRERKGWTQEALAEKVGVSRVHLANIESDDSASHHRTPSLALLDKTRGVFDRYHIVSRADRKAAVALLNGDNLGDNRPVRLETRRVTR